MAAYYLAVRTQTPCQKESSTQSTFVLREPAGPPLSREPGAVRDFVHLGHMLVPVLSEILTEYTFSTSREQGALKVV